MELGIIEWTVQLRFIIALALGFLVGLERESIKVDQKLVFGGVRTHPIISMFGFGCAWLYQIGATAMLPVGLLAIATLTGIAFVAKIRVDRFGTTSEVSALLNDVRSQDVVTILGFGRQARTIADSRQNDLAYLKIDGWALVGKPSGLGRDVI